MKTPTTQAQVEAQAAAIVSKWGDDPMRDVNLEGFRLRMWLAGDGPCVGTYRRPYVAYVFNHRDGVPIFAGDDFSPGASTPVDSDEAVRGLLGFLTLRPGDTDSEYFEGYSPEQLAFAAECAETLSIYADEGDSEYAPADLPDWGDE